MIGSIDSKKKEVLIIGGGISGLLSAFFLKKQGYSVQLHEASSRVGGLIETIQTPYGIAEKAAHSLMVSPELKKFFDEINVELLPVNSHSKARYIVRNGKMKRIPLTLIEIIHTLLNFFSKPKTRLSSSSLSLKDWGEQYLGIPATRYLLSPFVSGVFACTPQELNASISFPKLVPEKWNQSLFSFLRSKKAKKAPRPQMMVPKLGMQSLIDALAAALKDEIRLNSRISDLTAFKNTTYVITTPAQITSVLLAPIDPVSSEALKKIKYSPLISVTAFYPAQSFQQNIPTGVGVLIPRGEGFRILGALFNSNSFQHRVHDQNQYLSFTVMLGGSTDPEALLLSNTEIKATITHDLEKLFKVKAEPLELNIFRWSHAIPIYSNELREAQLALKNGFSSVAGNIIFSNYSKDVSIRGMLETLLTHASR